MTAAKKTSVSRHDILESSRGSVDETISLFYLGYRAGVAGPNAAR